MTLVEDADPVEQASSSDDGSRPIKKARLELENSHDGVHTSTTPEPEPHIFKLPLEILGEISILTGSPQYVLALTRTCRHFCYALIGEGAKYIWRQARCGPHVSFRQSDDPDDPDIISLPDPDQFFSEAAFAAFLFDPGACENCGKQTSEPYASFALRIRVCNKSRCRRKPAGFHRPGHPSRVVPTNEINNITAKFSRGVKFYPTPMSDVFSRDTDVDKAEAFLRGTRCGDEKFGSWCKRNHEWMKFCTSLAMWKIKFNEAYRRVKGANEEVGHRVADKFGWDYSDLMDCTIFGPFCKQKSSYLEWVGINDVDPLHDQIEAQLLALEERRQRRKTETALMKNRKDAEVLYNRLRSKGAYEYPPSLPTFRQLPILQLLQSGIYEKRGTTISDTLQNNSLMRQQLDQDVKQWIGTAKQDLAVVLGFPREWKSADRRALHPTERITAWFLCTKCGIDETNSKLGGCLDFASACLHVCQTKDGKADRYRKSKKAAWNPASFTKDEKAIAVMKSALSKLKTSDDTADSLYMKKHSLAVLCTSCEPSMVLSSRDLVVHCHRHDNMELSFLGQDEAVFYLNGFAYSYGVVTKLLRQGGKGIQKEIEKKNFGCRICLRRKQVKDSPANVPGGSANITGDQSYMDTEPQQTTRLECCSPIRPKEMPTLFNFNGMRSHLKAKHGIENIRDEDFFCSEQISQSFISFL